MTQRIDHFGAHNGTFQQRYTVFTDFFTPGGPIMFFHGEESIHLDCANDTIMYHFAKELGGMAVSLEHRYFGESLPLGHNVLGDTQHMKYLTLDNVIEDAAEFIGQIKSNVSGAEASKAIVASGSYGGFLAAVFRLNRPDAFFGSLASAAPVKGFGHDSDHKHNWWTYNTRTWQQKSAEASQKVKNAFDTLKARIETRNNIGGLKEELGLCDRPTVNDVTTLSLLLVALPRLWFFVTEFNYNFANPGRAPVANSFEAAVNITLEENDPIQVLNRTFWMWYGVPGITHLDCLDPLAFCTPTVPLIEQTPFSYITCLYMPLFSAGNIPEGTLWPAYTPPPSL